MLLCLSFEKSKGWLQQHCFVYKLCQNDYIIFKHIVHQCLVFIKDCLAFEKTIVIFVKYITAAGIHYWCVRYFWFNLQRSSAPSQKHKNDDSQHFTANEKID